MRYFFVMSSRIRSLRHRRPEHEVVVVHEHVLRVEGGRGAKEALEADLDPPSWLRAPPGLVSALELVLCSRPVLLQTARICEKSKKS